MGTHTFQVDLNLNLSQVHHATSSSISCCCGRPDCALLRQNCSVLDMVEKDVQTAAQLGQALLARHEAYMAGAKRDRMDFTTRIERLESDKQELEAENASHVRENKVLLDQLELINNTVTESDAQIKTLEASLLSSQQTIRRLEGSVARAGDLEEHLELLELEQERLQSEIRLSKEDARSHAQRYKEAERGILDMQDQLERMEKEARQERDRHQEVIGRMERQREMEKQLDTAAGRLKGAAATKSLTEPKRGSKVVNHFVRDLLQDNANLQLGIAELREMLLNSNDEIQSLREQLMHHQPMSPEGKSSVQSTLKDELAPLTEELPRTTSSISQELHIHHHHYYIPKPSKSRKKRHSLNPNMFYPPEMQSSASSGQWGVAASSSAPNMIGERVNHMPSPRLERHKWANHVSSSDFNSLPSSPHSNRVSSLFDSSVYDGGPPTSPTTSFDPTSPTWRASHRKRPSAASFQSLHNIPPFELASDTATPQRKRPSTTIREEDEDRERDEDIPGLGGNESSTEQSTTEDSEFSRDEYMPRPRLHRTHSHESIMSLTGGLDIHTLKSRPSQMTLRAPGGLEAVVTGVVAQPTLSLASSKRSDVVLRNHVSGRQSIRSVSASSDRQNPHSGSPAAAINRGIGKWVPSWRPWGSSNPGIPKLSVLTIRGSTPDTDGCDTPKPSPPKRSETTPRQFRERGLARAPGINQSGVIPGFHQYWTAHRRKGAPARVNPENVDTEALSEGLRE